MTPQRPSPLSDIPPRIRRLQEPRGWWEVAVEAVLAVIAVGGFVAIALSLIWRLIP